MRVEWFEVQWKGRELKATPRSKRSRVLNATNNRGHCEPHFTVIEYERDLPGIRTLPQSDLPCGKQMGRRRELANARMNGGHHVGKRTGLDKGG
jgi:hypothetical protein